MKCFIINIALIIFFCQLSLAESLHSNNIKPIIRVDHHTKINITEDDTIDVDCPRGGSKEISTSLHSLSGYYSYSESFAGLPAGFHWETKTMTSSFGGSTRVSGYISVDDTVTMGPHAVKISFTFYSYVSPSFSVDMNLKVNVSSLLSADFTATPVGGPSPLTVQFTNQSRGNGITHFRWEFGQYSGSSEENPSNTFTNTYDEVRNFSVKLTIRDSLGREQSIYKEDIISVFPALLETPETITPHKRTSTPRVSARPLFLKWTRIGGATNYNIKITTSIDFTQQTIVELETSNNDTTAIITGLEPNTNYRWQVQAFNDFYRSNWSDYDQFWTVPAGPSLESPKNGKVYTSVNQAIPFKWSTVTDWDNDFQISRDSTFTDEGWFVYVYNNGDATKWEIPGDLVPGKYYWRVRHYFKPGVTTEWSEIFSFNVKSGNDHWEIKKLNVPFDLNSCCVVDTENMWVVGDQGVILHSVDGGSNWMPSYSNIESSLNSVCFVNGIGWAAGADGTILKYENNAWSVQNTPASDTLNSIFFIDESNGWAAGNNFRLLSTKNGGDTWSLAIPFFNQRYGKFNSIHANNESVWIVGEEIITNNQGEKEQQDITISSTLQGTIWKEYDDNLFSDAPFCDVWVSDNGDKWAISEWGYIYIWDSFFESWMDINKNDFWKYSDKYKSFEYRLNSIHFTDDNFGIVVGTKGYIEQTNDNGTNWNRLTIGTDLSLNDAHFISKNCGLIVADSGHVFLKNNTLTGIQDNKIKTVSRFDLSYAWPNPANPSTRIGYTLPRATEIKLELFNILGQKVQILYKGYHAAGTFEKNINLSNINSGRYFIRLSSELGTKVQGITVVK